MKMDTIKDTGGESQPVLVQKIAYCDVHAPTENSGKAKLNKKHVKTLLNVDDL